MNDLLNIDEFTNQYIKVYNKINDIFNTFATEFKTFRIVLKRFYLSHDSFPNSYKDSLDIEAEIVVFNPGKIFKQQNGPIKIISEEKSLVISFKLVIDINKDNRNKIEENIIYFCRFLCENYKDNFKKLIFDYNIRALDFNNEDIEFDVIKIKEK